MRKQNESKHRAASSNVSQYYVYIVECNDETLYVGSTTDVLKRIKAHNTSKHGAHYTKIRRPVRLVYHESCSTYAGARSREAALKRLKRSEKMALIAAYAAVDSI